MTSTPGTSASLPQAHAGDDPDTLRETIAAARAERLIR